MPGLAPPVTGEREGLLAFLAQQRLVLRLTAYGLTDEQIRLAPTASALTIGGLIKHLSSAERTWTDTVLGQYTPDERRYRSQFEMAAGETLGSILDEYAGAAARTDGVMTGIEDLGQPVPVPRGVPWFPSDVEAWSVRWVLLHLIQETARHAGHADIVRESIDGATAFPLIAAAEGWPATPWMQPWSPGDPA